MKKLILIPLLLLAIFAAGQSYQLKSGNWNYSGYNKFTATKLKVGNTVLSETKVKELDTLIAKKGDTIQISTIIPIPPDPIISRGATVKYGRYKVVQGVNIIKH